MDHLTKTIAAHRWAGIYETCECFKPWDFDADTMSRDEHAAHVAAAIREHRTITTVDEVETLPVGTVIRDDSGDVYQRGDNDGTGACWHTPGYRSSWHPGAFGGPNLPSVILWRPDEDGDL